MTFEEWLAVRNAENELRRVPGPTNMPPSLRFDLARSGRGMASSKRRLACAIELPGSAVSRCVGAASRTCEPVVRRCCGGLNRGCSRLTA
jgi:hypothetical protein